MNDRSTFLGRLGALTQVTFAVLIASFSLFSVEPDFVPRWTVIVLAYSLPAVVALAGLAARRPMLLVAAGLASGVGSVLAFSGVTLIFLVPAVLLLAGAARLPDVRDPTRGGWLGGVAQLLIGAAIIVLLVGAGGSALLLTDAGCWITHQGSTGSRIEVLPYSTGGMELSGDAVSGGCTNGLISARGVGLGVVLAGATLGLAALAARRRDRWSDDTPAAGGPPHVPVV